MKKLKNKSSKNLLITISTENISSLKAIVSLHVKIPLVIELFLNSDASIKKLQKTWLNINIANQYAYCHCILSTTSRHKTVIIIAKSKITKVDPIQQAHWSPKATDAIMVTQDVITY